MSGMRYLKLIISVLTAVVCMNSCEFVSSIIHDEDVIASVGAHKLYRSELMAVIPYGISQEDSLKMAEQFINSWASDLVFLDIAESQLSKTEKNVTAELEDYRKALLKYRYEQLYVDQRLDTEVSEDQVSSFYASHKGDYVLRIPIVKAKFLKISADSPNLEVIRRKMPSDDEEDVALVDSLARLSADRYTDFGGGWIDMIALSKEFGEDYGSLISLMNNSFIAVEDDYGKLNIAYIAEYMRAGTQAPVEYCADEIRDVIVSARKKLLVSTLEQDLLEQARQDNRFKIYKEKNE